jgi:hypothetical protein
MLQKSVAQNRERNLNHGMLEELEKAHIYIEQSHQRLKEVEKRLQRLEE